MAGAQGQLGRRGMSTEESYGPINALAEHWARKGNGEIEKVQATLNLSRQLLANGEVKPYSEGENPFEPQPYPWESSEVSADIPLRLFLGTVSDLTSGQGHTVWFAAAPARSEDEFRRKLANHIGHTLANGAKVGTDSSDFPFSQTFISPKLRQRLDKHQDGKRMSSELFFLSRLHDNQS